MRGSGPPTQPAAPARATPTLAGAAGWKSMLLTTASTTGDVGRRDIISSPRLEPSALQAENQAERINDTAVPRAPLQDVAGRDRPPPVRVLGHDRHAVGPNRHDSVAVSPGGGNNLGNA